MKKKRYGAKSMILDGKNKPFCLERWIPSEAKKRWFRWVWTKWERLTITENGVYLDGKLFAKGKLTLQKQKMRRIRRSGK